MFLHRCAICGKEYLPAGVHAAWHRFIGPISKRLLHIYFCYCKNRQIKASEDYLIIPYDELVEAIKEVGREMKVQ